MLTCCPACATTFRVTPEQLKIKAGTVRCGKCQAVFNALDSLADTAAPPLEPAAAAKPLPLSPVENPASAIASADVPDDSQSIDLAPAEDAGNTGDSPVFEAEPILSVAEKDENFDESDDNFYISAVTNDSGAGLDAVPPEGTPAALPAELSPAAVRDDALAVGLVAARDASEIPGYSKWTEGAFTGVNSIAEPLARPLWPFVVIASLLLLVFSGQLVYHFRTELSVLTPGLRSVLVTACHSLGCTVPLPRNAELVSIESSDLQVDASRNGMILLSATLQNRAAYAQSWPLLEITLTDTQDRVVLRRVLQAAEYLPQKLDPAVFPAHGDAAIHLWLEAQGITAAGYRLYVFYP